MAEATKAAWESWLRHWYGENVVEDKHAACLHCLARGKMLFQWHDRYEERSEVSNSAFDHCSLWRIGNEPLVLVSQPYNFGHEEIHALLDYCDAHGLQLEMNQSAAFHNPGEVEGVTIWNRVIREKHRRDR